MKGALQRLEAQGVEVRVLAGFPLRGAYGTTAVRGDGIMHCKVLLADGVLMAGSCNWTTSSQANHELTVRVELSEEGQREARQLVGAIFAAGSPRE